MGALLQHQQHDRVLKAGMYILLRRGRGGANLRVWEGQLNGYSGDTLMRSREVGCVGIAATAASSKMTECFMAGLWILLRNSWGLSALVCGGGRGRMFHGHVGDTWTGS